MQQAVHCRIQESTCFLDMYKYEKDLKAGKI